MEPEINASREPAENVTGSCVGTVKRKVYIEGMGEVEMILSIECEQDMFTILKALCSRRTPEFTSQEIADWKEVWEVIKDCDFEAIKRKYKVRILREEEPYEWVQDDPFDFEGNVSHETMPDEVTMQGWVGDIFNEG